MENEFFESYGLIVALTKLQSDKGFSLGKTKLQKLLFLLKEIRNVPMTYHYQLYTYGPYSSDVSGDLSYLNTVNVVRIIEEENLQKITLGDKASAAILRLDTIPSDLHANLEFITNKFGSRLAKDLELLATIVYVMQYDQSSKNSRDEIIQKTYEIKNKFSIDKIKGCFHEIEELCEPQAC